MAINNRFRIFKKPTVIAYIVYNIIYSFYHAGYLEQRVYYGALLVFCVIGVLELCVKNSFKIPLSRLEFRYEFRVFLIIALCFLLISLVIQLINQDFEIYTEVQLIYFIMPAFIVFLLSNIIGPEDYDTIMFIIFLRICLQFFMEFGSLLSFQAIRSITWFDSDSSLFESEVAHDFFLVTVYFLFCGKKKLAAVTTVLCLLSFKRFSMLYCIAAWIVYRFIPHKKVSSKYVWIGTAVFLINSFLINWMYSDAGTSFLMQTFNFDLNRFTTNRVYIYRRVVSAFNGTYNGFGSITNFFNSLGGLWARLGMHSDILKIFFETTILGSFCMIYGFLSLCKKDYRILFMFSYIYVEMTISQFLRLMNPWVIFLLFILRVQNEQEIENRKPRLKA